MTSPLTNIDRASRVWIFASSVAMDETKRRTVIAEVDRFLEGWESHGVRLPAHCDILHDRFLVVAADKRTDASGCSIDKLFHLLGQLSETLELPLLESQWFYYRDAEGAVQSVSRGDFRAKAGSGELGPETIVFDTNVEDLASILDGRWEKRAADSWHARML